MCRFLNNLYINHEASRDIPKHSNMKNTDCTQTEAATTTAKITTTIMTTYCKATTLDRVIQLGKPN